MSIFKLATKGMDARASFNVLRRHLFALFHHMTMQKLINFCMAEYSLLTKKTVLKSYPYILKVESTNVCNVRCAYCYDSRRKPDSNERRFGRMSVEDFKKIVDDVGSYLFKINLYGFGEPFLYTETIDMIKYARQKNIGIGISSNMNFRNPDMPTYIVESGLEVLIFSCHGVTQESYGQFMVGGNMELAMKNLAKVMTERKRLGSSTPFIDWQYCVTRFNEHEIPMAREQAKALGVQVRFIQPSFPEEADQKWYADYFKKKQINQNQAMEPAQGCSWPYRSAYISFDGGFLPCCTQNTRLLSNDFGNIFESDFKTIWNNSRYQRSRKLIANPEDSNAIQCDSICATCPVTQVNTLAIEVSAEKP